jgi:hypothetical protein
MDDVKMFSQRMFKGASGKDDEPISKVTNDVFTMNLILVAHDHLMYLMHVQLCNVICSEMSV